MTLSQALITIDKDNTKKVVISMEKSYKERKPKIEYSPQAINEIFSGFSSVVKSANVRRPLQ